MTLARLCWPAPLCLALALGAGSAEAQTGRIVHDDERMTISRTDGVSRTSCIVTLEPRQSRGGPDAPRLILRFAAERDQPGPVRAVEIYPATRGRDWTAEIVLGDSRTDFPPARLAASEAGSHPAWAGLAGDRAFDVTIRWSSGIFATSRFDPLEVIALLEQITALCEMDLSGFGPMAQRFAEREADLRLTPETMRAVRWRLIRRFRPGAEQPGEAAALNEEERDLLARWASEQGLGPLRFLDEPLVARMLEEPFPIEHKRRRGRNAQLFRDWYYYEIPTDAENVCYIGTRAESVTGAQPWFAPDLRFFVSDTPAAPALLGIDLVSPAAFAPGTAPVAEIGGAELPLYITAEGTVLPGDGSPDTALIKAMVSATSLEIRGPADPGRTIPGETGEAETTIRFSALGFTAAFGAMMAGCRRPDVIEWIR